jgi:hypothetical protein
MKNLYRILSVGTALVVANGVHAGNLVKNPSFEGATYSTEQSDALPVDWTFTPATDGDNTDFFITTSPFDSTSAEDGDQFAVFGATGVTFDYISQTLSTVNGDSYWVSFWLNNNDELSEGASEFSAYWDGTDIGPDITPESAEFGWTEFSTVVQGTGSDTITFGGLNVPAFIGLDNVMVCGAAGSAVPDQGVDLATLAATLAGICALSARMSRRQAA